MIKVQYLVMLLLLSSHVSSISAKNCDVNYMKMVVTSACDVLARKLRSIDMTSFDNRPHAVDDSTLYQYTVWNSTEENHGVRTERSIDFHPLQFQHKYFHHERYDLKHHNGYMNVSFSKKLYNKLMHLERNSHPNLTKEIFSDLGKPVGKFSRAHHRFRHRQMEPESIENEVLDSNELMQKRIKRGDQRLKSESFANLIFCCENPLHNVCKDHLCFV